MNKYMKHSLGELLLQKGAIKPEQLEQARQEEQAKGESLFKVLRGWGSSHRGRSPISWRSSPISAH